MPTHARCRSGRLVTLCAAACLATSAAATAGTVSVFGDLSYGQDRIPFELNDAVHVGATRRTVAAVRANGSIMAWGYDGNGEVTNVPSGPVFTKVFGGWGFTFFGLTDQGQLISWGRNTVGQADVAALPAGRRYVKAAASFFHGAGLRDDGSLVVWGASNPAIFTPTQQATIRTVPTLASGAVWSDFGVGYRTTIGLTSDGAIRAWGIDLYGDTAVPALPTGLTYTGLAFGGTFAVGLRSNGSIVAWGDDYFAQVAGVPQPAPGVQCTQICAGADHAFAQFNDGSWQGWGTNYDGESDPANLSGDTMQQLVASGGFNVMLVGAQCFGDLDGSLEVDAGDVAFALLDFGPCPGCPADLDGTGDVDFGDIALVLLSVGPCQ